MSLATTVATAIEKVNDLMDLVKGQYNKWDGEVKAKIAELESWVQTINIKNDGGVIKDLDGKRLNNVIFNVRGYSELDKEFFYDIPRSASGYVMKITCGMAHWSGSQYGVAREVFIHGYDTDVVAKLDSSTSSDEAGSWEITAPDSSTIRIKHVAGTYAGGAAFFINVIGENNV